MLVKYSIHRESAKVGAVEEVSDEYGERLIAAGQAKRADGPAVESARAAAAVAGDPSTDAAAAGGRRVRRAAPTADAPAE
ncbi:hypothetical protein ACH47B_06550 [Rhodococcus sp. NPDC019627]|uniref:hypothetical protein n=1 Tax=unclassified Rhodococcus (in: high G+C Gram-positive bacteria) TaxID=192944 RepID=UPI0037923AF9